MPERAPAEEPPRRRAARRAARVLLWIAAALVVLLLTTVGAAFLCHSPVPWLPVRRAMAAVFVLAVIGAFVLLRPRRMAFLVFLLLFGVVLTWYWMIPPSNDRNWVPEVARTAHAEYAGDVLTIRDLRNFRYRSADDFDEVWEDRSFDLSQLRTLDICFCYWGPRAIAHTMLSFGFGDDQFLCLSVETRREDGEAYDPIASFFKRFELTYVFGDERDLVGLRANHRHEDVYLFPTRFTPAETRRLLDDVLARANSLHRKPEFYRTIRDNCTTSLVGHINRARDRKVPFDASLILNGLYPEHAYATGAIPNDRPFAEVMERHRVNARALEAGDAPDFSRRIRHGLDRP